MYVSDFGYNLMGDGSCGFGGSLGKSEGDDAGTGFIGGDTSVSINTKFFSDCVQMCNIYHSKYTKWINKNQWQKDIWGLDRHKECTGVSWSTKRPFSNCVLYSGDLPSAPYTSASWTNSYQCYRRGMTNIDNYNPE